MHRLLLLQTAALVCGFIIDFFVGDPHCLPHPAVGMGRLISACEKRWRRGTRREDLRGGILTVITLIAAAVLVPSVLLAAAWRLHPALYFAVDSILCWQMVAARQLARESRRVQWALEKQDTEGARKAVSMIVGRDTDVLDADGICRAAVETVAENASDGVIAPIFWMMLFGAVGGFCYKAVNTMDSMIGYRNETYRYFGRAAARTDDFLNWLPARLSALLMIAVCPLCGLRGGNAWRIFRRDRYKHASPNSAQTESVCAGALGVRLAGDAVYGGIVHKKEYIGDPLRRIEPKDIARANRLMYTASAAMLLSAVLIRAAVLACL